MTWSYGGDPTASDKDWVRWRVGDTLTADQLQSDEEITAAVSEYGDKVLAAAGAADAISALYARRVDSKMGKLDLKWSQMSERYAALADDLRIEAGSAGVAPWSGAISIDAKQAEQEDTDRVKPSFARGMFQVEGVVLHGETDGVVST